MIAGGILVALAASVANAGAIVLQAGEDRRAPLSDSGRAALLLGLARRPRWLAGTGLMILAWPLQIVALMLAPLTVVQPVLASSQLILLGIARATLQERVGASEVLGALAIVSGASAVIWAAPHHTVADPHAAQVAAPLVLVGVIALGAYGLGRLRPRLPISLVIGAGVAYAWIDFANKLLAGAAARGRVGEASLWLVATVGFGALAFLQETSALQRRPAVTVAPVIGAIHGPLPILMALWSGIEVWGASAHHVAPLVAGLVVITAGAAALGRSPAVTRLAAGEDGTGHGAAIPPPSPRPAGARRSPSSPSPACARPRRTLGAPAPAAAALRWRALPVRSRPAPEALRRRPARDELG